MMDLNDSLIGILDTEEKLRNAAPGQISELMYELGQFASALEKHLGDYEMEYEREWAEMYKEAIKDKMSTTAAKNHADVELAELKGQIKRLTRFVGSAWKVQTSAMARLKHLEQESRGAT